LAWAALHRPNWRRFGLPERFCPSAVAAPLAQLAADNTRLPLLALRVLRSTWIVRTGEEFPRLTNWFVNEIR
jgi:hypothetical protein